MNKEDWEKVKNLLPYSKINMKIDNYNVSICCEPYKPLHFHYMIYIDEHWKMAWLTEDCEIRKRFCQKHQKSMLSASDRKKLKREKKAVRKAVEEKMMYYYYTPYWKSFTAMKLHLLKNNENIELVDYGDDIPDLQGF